jgi:hypothetical protein
MIVQKTEVCAIFQGVSIMKSIVISVSWFTLTTLVAIQLLMLGSTGEGMDSIAAAVDLEARRPSMDMPISIDEMCNVIVCKDCGIGVPFEWVPAHIKGHHGIRVTGEQVSTFLRLEGDSMTIAQAEDWIQSTWAGRAIQNIPVVKGHRCVEIRESRVHGLKCHVYSGDLRSNNSIIILPSTSTRCNECQYSAVTTRVMRNHFSKEHKGLKTAEHCEECEVQLVFKARLHKYIQVDGRDVMEVDSGDNLDWRRAADMEFSESTANVKISGGNTHENLRLMNAFIAKTRWDLMVHGKDLEEIVTIAGVPPSHQNLYKIILCGRRYVHKTCEALDRGSVIIKRLLMTGRYLMIREYH